MVSSERDEELKFKDCMARYVELDIVAERVIANEIKPDSNFVTDCKNVLTEIKTFEGLKDTNARLQRIAIRNLPEYINYVQVNWPKDF
jgi:hypothetical protein